MPSASVAVRTVASLTSLALLNAMRASIPAPRARRSRVPRTAPTARATIPDSGLSKKRVSIWRQVLWPRRVKPRWTMSAPPSTRWRTSNGATDWKNTSAPPSLAANPIHVSVPLGGGRLGRAGLLDGSRGWTSPGVTPPYWPSRCSSSACTGAASSRIARAPRMTRSYGLGAPGANSQVMMPGNAPSSRRAVRRLRPHAAVAEGGRLEPASGRRGSALPPDAHRPRAVVPDGDVRAHGQRDPGDGDARRAVPGPAVGPLLGGAAPRRKPDAARTQGSARDAVAVPGAAPDVLRLRRAGGPAAPRRRGPHRDPLPHGDAGRGGSVVPDDGVLR